VEQVKSEEMRQLVRMHVAGRIGEMLAEPLTVPGDSWSSPGRTVTLHELIDEEIKKQLTVTNNMRHTGEQNVLTRVIRETVNTRLETDLKAAFDKARNEMLNAAAEVGKKALQAAVGKAFG
jgi:hypothetical protein